MCDAPSPTHLLNELYRIGEEMHAALVADDLDAFFSGMEARTALAEQLKATPPPEPRPPEWEALAERMQLQYDELVTAIEQHRQHIAHLLNHQQRFKKAQAGYQPAGQPLPRGVLHRNVQG